MNWDAWMPLLVVLSSLLVGLVIFVLAEDRVKTRIWLNMVGALFKLVLVAIMLVNAVRGAFLGSVVADHRVCDWLPGGVAESQPFLRFFQSLRDRNGRCGAGR